MSEVNLDSNEDQVTCAVCGYYFAGTAFVVQIVNHMRKHEEAQS